MPSFALRPLSAVLLLASLLAGCVSGPRQQVAWTEPSLGTSSRVLAGQRILVDCGSADPGLRQSCQEVLSREVAAAGGDPVVLEAPQALTSEGTPGAQLSATALSMGASAVFTLGLAAGSVNDMGSGLSIGLGAFSIGRGGGTGVGLSAPLGGGTPSVGLVGNGQITDARSRRLVWSATFSSSPSGNLQAQAASLAHAVVSSAKSAGLF